MLIESRDIIEIINKMEKVYLHRIADMEKKYVLTFDQNLDKKLDEFKCRSELRSILKIRDEIVGYLQTKQMENKE